MIGENIKRFRKEKGLTQRQLADRLECAEITIRQYETGKREPRLDVIKKIADALEVNEFVLMATEYQYFHDEVVQLALENNTNTLLNNIDDPETLAMLVRNYENSFLLTLSNVGFIVKELENGDIEIFNSDKTKHTILDYSRLETIQDEIMNYIQFIIEKEFSRDGED